MYKGKKIVKFKKDFHEVNLLVPWSITIGVVFFLVFVYFIWIIEFDIFRNPKIITDNHLRYGLLIFAFFLTIEIIRLLSRVLAKWINLGYQSRFHHIPDINSYVESREHSFFTEKKYDHVVLLLHGFSGSPQEFEFLIPYLKESGINYYIPNLMGFGLDNTVVLNNTRRQDWYRMCLGAYDYLSKISNKVSVVGQSMGAILAAYVATNRPVHQLILTSPGFYTMDVHVKHKILLTMPIISTLYILLVPYVPKPLNKERGYVGDTLDPEVARSMFHYLAVPVGSLREVFLMQDEARLDKMNYDNLNIIYGQHEKTISMDKLFKSLDVQCVKYKSHCLPNSAHNVMQDLDRENGCKLVADILLGTRV